MKTAHALVLAFAVLVELVISGWQPRDRFTWLLEVAPVLLAGPVIAFTWRRFRWTSLALVLIALHASILILGGHYTYAEVPLGFWMQDAFGFARNHYDRIGHVAQGFVPALVARELYLRTSPLKRGGWLFFIVTCTCLAISALYELVEWWAALATGEAATAFLGTQGDVWDTQWDMFLALCGALTAQLLLARLHDRQLRVLTESDTTGGRRG